MNIDYRYKLIFLFVTALLIAACSGTNTKSQLADNKPQLMTTKQFLPIQEFDKKTSLPVPYEAKENPYASQKGRIKKESVSAFIAAKRAFRAKQWQRTKTILMPLTESDKSLSGPWIMLGDIAVEEKNIEEAIKHYEKAIQVNRKNINAYVKLAKLQREQGKFIIAQNTYAQVLQLWPDFPEAHLNVGVLYDIYLNHPLRAQQHMEAYLYLTGWKDKKVQTWLAEVQSRTGVATTYKMDAGDNAAPLTTIGK